MKTGRRWSDQPHHHEPTNLGPLRIIHTTRPPRPKRRRLHPVDVFLGLLLLALLILATGLLGSLVR